jgi:hypothetical protein
MRLTGARCAHPQQTSTPSQAFQQQRIADEEARGAGGFDGPPHANARSFSGSSGVRLLPPFACSAGDSCSRDVALERRVSISCALAQLRTMSLPCGLLSNGVRPLTDSSRGSRIQR